MLDLLYLAAQFSDQLLVGLDFLHVLLLDLHILLLQLTVLPLGLRDLISQIIILGLDGPVVGVLPPEGVDGFVSLQGFQVGVDPAVVGTHWPSVHC